METPEKVSLECHSFLGSSSSILHSDLFASNSESSVSKGEGFSCKILQNLSESSHKPSIQLINLTKHFPGQTPRKLLLPLFYQEPELSPKGRRSLSLNSMQASSMLIPENDRKQMTRTTINTQSNTDLNEIQPEFLKDKEKFEFEKGLKKGNIEITEFGNSPCIFSCQKCKFEGASIVVRSDEDKWMWRKMKITFCCCFLERDSGVVEHICPGCSEVVFRLNRD